MWCRSSLRFYGCRLLTFNISNKWDCDVNYMCHVLSTTVPCKPWTGRLISLSAESNYWQLFWKLLLFISANRRKKVFFSKLKKYMDYSALPFYHVQVKRVPSIWIGHTLNGELILIMFTLTLIQVKFFRYKAVYNFHKRIDFSTKSFMSDANQSNDLNYVFENFVIYCF